MRVKESQYLDSIAREWSEITPQRLWRSHSDAVNLTLLGRWLPTRPARRLLKTDIFEEAVGNGLYPVLSERAGEVVVMDLSMPMVTMARARYLGLRAVCADVRRLPFEDGAFDVIVSTSTLDHFQSRDEIQTSLQELNRVLRPAGQLLLTLDNLANPIIALRNLLPYKLLHRLGLVPYYIGTTYGPRGLRRIVERAGLTVLEVRAALHCPRVIAVALARNVEKRTALRTQEQFLRGLMAFERLSSWPTRFLTGHFVAVRAVKPCVRGEGV